MTYCLYTTQNLHLEFIYPRELEIKETTETAASSYLDCYLYIDNGKLTTRLYYKRDDFNFPFVNFPFLSSNIPSAPAYGVYVSQLIRYARACSNYRDFMDRGKVLTTKLLSQGYQKTKLVATLKKFYGRHHDLVNPYNVAVSRIVSDVLVSHHWTRCLPWPYMLKHFQIMILCWSLTFLRQK